MFFIYFCSIFFENKNWYCFLGLIIYFIFWIKKAHLVDFGKMGILLMMFIGFGVCMQGYLSELVIGNSDSDSSQALVKNFCRLKKFVMSSYFERYESLLQSNFQDCVRDEISRTEKLLLDDVRHRLRLSVSRRHLIGEGSHRQLSSTISVHLQSQSSPELPTHFCKVILIERLPSGVFADPFELQHLHQRGAFSDVAVFGDTNLELPAFLSNQTIVEIHMNAGHNLLLSSENQLEIKVDLPLHVRYQPLDDSGYTDVEFGPPDLFMQCDLEGKPRDGGWFVMPTIDVNESPSNAVVWRIPSGIRTHASIVSVVTFLAAFLSTLIIVVTSIFHSDAKLCKNVKQS